MCYLRYHVLLLSDFYYNNAVVLIILQLGYLLAIPATRNALESEDYNLPDLEFMVNIFDAES